MNRERKQQQKTHGKPVVMSGIVHHNQLTKVYLGWNDAVVINTVSKLQHTTYNIHNIQLHFPFLLFSSSINPFCRSGVRSA